MKHISMMGYKKLTKKGSIGQFPPEILFQHSCAIWAQFGQKVVQPYVPGNCASQFTL